jgi:DNA-binding transcriptional LysR family regulator
MDIHQLKTFVTVAREGSVTRASGLLHLSQPAVSAHIKAMEDALGLSLFERTARGMSLTHDGQRLLAKAEQTLAAHQELLVEASRTKRELAGKLRLGAGTSSNNEAIGRLLTALARRWPDVEVTLKHRSSQEILDGLRNGTLDAGFYNHPDEPDVDLETIEVGEFAVHLVAAPGLVAPAQLPNWSALAELSWIYPTEAACCNRTAERLFAAHRFRPRRIVSADRQDVTKALVTSGIGVGLLHADTAMDAAERGELELLFEAETRVRVYFAHLAKRADDPVIRAAASILRPKPRA